jgi:hypothetical protein
VVVADLPALEGSAAEGGPPLRAGLEAFLVRPPTGPLVGLRALAGADGECGGTDAIKPPGVWAAGELAGVLAAASALGRGPRNPARAVEAAATELEAVAGERAVVIVTGAEEGCGADLCGDLPPPGGAVVRLHVVLLALASEPAAEPGFPEAGADGIPAPVFEPAWAAPYRCLAERSGGTVSAVATPAELEGVLRRIASGLESAVAVRAFHGTGREVKGISPGGEAGWGVALWPSGGDGQGDEVRSADLVPAAFALPGGVYVVKSRYGGQAKTAAVAVAPGERAEVRVSFPTGELFVQALDGAGGEISGDSVGFSCAWGAEVLQGNVGEETVVASTCSFPSRFELPPGIYRVRARWKGFERVIEEAAVEGGASTVRAVSFGAAGE